MSAPNATQWLVPDWPDLPSGVGVLCTTRRGGVSAAPYDDGQGKGGLNLGTHVGDVPRCVERNRDILRAELPAEPVWLTQVHGTRVLDAGTVHHDAAPPIADASFTHERGVVCALPDGVLRFTPHWPNDLAEIPFVLESVDQVLSLLQPT